MKGDRNFLVLGLFVTATSAFYVPDQRSNSLQGNQIAEKELSTATSLAKSWGFDGGLQFLRVAGVGESVESAAQAPGPACLALALLGGDPPLRRRWSSGEPFVQVSISKTTSSWTTQTAASLLAVDALNKGAGMYEAVTGRPLYPFRLIVTQLRANNSSATPFAVWNISSGEVLLDEGVLENIGKFPQQIGSILSRFSESLFHHLSKMVKPVLSPDSEIQANAPWSLLFSTAVPASIAIAVGSQVPVWFCFACPIVLGLLAPLVFNAGFGTAASLICQHYQLPAEECNDLWYGAFALAMVLSLASAIPIVFLCQLPKCAKQG